MLEMRLLSGLSLNFLWSRVREGESCKRLDNCWLSIVFPFCGQRTLVLVLLSPCACFPFSQVIIYLTSREINYKQPCVFSHRPKLALDGDMEPLQAACCLLPAWAPACRHSWPGRAPVWFLLSLIRVCPHLVSLYDCPASPQLTLSQASSPLFSSSPRQHDALCLA